MPQGLLYLRGNVEQVVQVILGHGIHGQHRPADGLGDGLNALPGELRLNEDQLDTRLAGPVDQPLQLPRGRLLAPGLHRHLLEPVILREVTEGWMEHIELPPLKRGQNRRNAGIYIVQVCLERREVPLVVRCPIRVQPNQLGGDVAGYDRPLPHRVLGGRRADASPGVRNRLKTSTLTG